MIQLSVLTGWRAQGTRTVAVRSACVGRKMPFSLFPHLTGGTFCWPCWQRLVLESIAMDLWRAELLILTRLQHESRAGVRLEP